MGDCKPRASLRSEAVELSVAPDFGARITELLDLRTGRNWLSGDNHTPIPRDETLFGARAAFGWDECFPTVAPCEASMAPWRRRLRDHGDLWGRAWRLDRHDESSLATSLEGDGFRFMRSLSLIGDTLMADYSVANSGDVPLPFLWSMHPLFALTSGETLELDGVDRVEATYLSPAVAPRTRLSLAWPSGDGRTPFPLDRVQPATAGFAGKFYASAPSPGRARLGGDGQWLEMGWEGVEHIGIWLTYGAWPEPNSNIQVAIEPTTAPFDCLADAVAASRGCDLAPGGEKTWRVSLRLRVDRMR